MNWKKKFPVDRSTVRKLTKYVGAGGGLSINFDSMLLGERVFMILKRIR